MIFLAEFMVGTLSFIFREHLTRSLKAELLYGIEKHYNVTREPGTLPAVWDHIHEEVIVLIKTRRGMKNSLKCLSTRRDTFKLS